KSQGKDPQPRSTERVQEYFPYIIEAYLTKKPGQERGSAELTPQRLYIAAPDDDIAYLIFGLIYCLPPRLVRNITFSTYEHLEHNHTEPPMEIVGTCWLSGSDKDS